MSHLERPSMALVNAQKELARRRKLAGIDTRLSTDKKESSDLSWIEQIRRPALLPTVDVETEASDYKAAVVRIAPTLAAWCLDPGHLYNGVRVDGPYRLYKLMHGLDGDGRGWLVYADVKAVLCDAESNLYTYGRRRLLEVLRRGEGLFWHRVKGRDGRLQIRLVSRAKVVAATCGHLSGREVSVPMVGLIGKQAEANALLYATFHAGRRKAMPISRQRLSEAVGCSPYRQRAYEQHSKVKVIQNIQIVDAYSDYRLERARERGGLHHAYKHTDIWGRINERRPGAAYVAARLPNTYTAPDIITVLHSRRQKAINRDCRHDDLCAPGSGGSSDGLTRVFYTDAAAAISRVGIDDVAFWRQTPDDHRTAVWKTFGERLPVG